MNLLTFGRKRHGRLEPEVTRDWGGCYLLIAHVPTSTLHAGTDVKV